MLASEVSTITGQVHIERNVDGGARLSIQLLGHLARELVPNCRHSFRIRLAHLDSGPRTQHCVAAGLGLHRARGKPKAVITYPASKSA